VRTSFGFTVAGAETVFTLGPSLRDIELELVREEQERERSSEGAADAGEDTMTGYLMLGLEIEGQQ
jgi:hypothetical protein